MIVVSNTSPIMNLAVAGHLNLLEQLYDKIFIPEAVLQELSTIRSEQLGVLTIQVPSWSEKRQLNLFSMMLLLKQVFG